MQVVLPARLALLDTFAELARLNQHRPMLYAQKGSIAQIMQILGELKKSLAPRVNTEQLKAVQPTRSALIALQGSIVKALDTTR